jgi:hypothetical protein
VAANFLAECGPVQAQELGGGGPVAVAVPQDGLHKGRRGQLQEALVELRVVAARLFASDTLLPVADRVVSALLIYLDSRGLLVETLVVWMGRTPFINKGPRRDHWSFCYSLIMAGGGICGRLVHGSSDRSTAYAGANATSPGDIAATIYHCLGIDHHGHVTDQQGRPRPVGAGEPIQPRWTEISPIACARPRKLEIDIGGN